VNTAVAVSSALLSRLCSVFASIRSLDKISGEVDISFGARLTGVCMIGSSSSIGGSGAFTGNVFFAAMPYPIYRNSASLSGLIAILAFGTAT
jgi:hypothetical protein